MTATNATTTERGATKAKKPKTAAANPDVYTMAEAARLKGVSYHTVSRAVRRGKLPAQRLGRMALITADDLRDWRPMRERAPRKYRRREPDPGATPALLDLASGERVSLAERLATLYELIHSSAGQLPTDEFLALLSDRLASALDLRRVAIWVLNDQGTVLRRAAFYGAPITGLDEIDLVRHPEVRQAIESDDGVRVVHNSGTTGLPLDNLSDLMLAPLRVGGRLVGMVSGDRGGAQFSLSDDQVVMAEGLGSQAALALDRARLRDERELRAKQLQAIIDNVAEVVLAVDASGSVTSISRHGRDLYGVDEQASDATLSTVVRGLGHGETSPVVQAINGETVRDRRFVVIRQDGGEQPVSVNAMPIRNEDGVVTGAVAVLRSLDR